MTDPAGEWVLRDEATVRGGDLAIARLGVSSPYGRRYDLEVVRTRATEVACFAVDHEDRLALALRYGFATGRRGWCLPAALVHDGEDILAAAERAMRDVCGWTIQSPRPEWSLTRWPERCDLVTTIVTARARRGEGPPGHDIDQVGWFDHQDIRRILRAGHLHDAVTAAALYWWLALGAHQ